ncbi:MAG: SUMF1/EgtB/PvdO family nonheme iron enzyme [Lentisphaeria bacterium]|nr:SUMF1/EgtB/PvdO family nonheme iron enzyme [Lentisphaeria bacterium]
MRPKMDVCLLLLALGTVYGAPAAAAGKPIAAVFPIEVRRVRISAADRETLGETLGAKLTGRGGYLVIPKDQLQEKLRRQKKRSYKRCYAKSCQIAIGQELAAQKAISTRITRIGRRCQVIIKVWDLKKSAAERAATSTGRCSAASLLGLIEAATTKLLRDSSSGWAPRPEQRCSWGKVAVGKHCCWPGQDWGASTGRCIGKPARCPRGMKRGARDCLFPSKAGEVWLPLPRGTFEMGNKARKDERPVRRVTLKPFAMLKTEVTVAQYRACVKAGKCTKPTPSVGDRADYNWSNGRGDKHPINGVLRKQAKAFCAWVGGRLPSEAEWEYAARSGGKRQLYPWGNEKASCRRAVVFGQDRGGCDRGTTWPVCSKPGGNSAQGLCDLVGNVSEWVADCWQADYVGAPKDNAPRKTCRGKHEALSIVHRGGTWATGSSFLYQATRRESGAPWYADKGHGIRCARDL